MHMGRPARDLRSSSYFHVGNRGIDGSDIFAVDDDWFAFEAELQRTVDRFNVWLSCSPTTTGAVADRCEIDGRGAKPRCGFWKA